MSRLSRAFLEETYGLAWGTPPDRLFQVDVAEALVRDGAAVLRAPTGSGKTRAALLAPLAAWRAGEPLVDRVIYAVPLRSLASSLADEARAAVDALGLRARITLQMGGCEDDPLYERGHVIFTTIDQLLSRYLSLPYSLGAGRANMCPGALLGSLIVLDEVHLFDFDRALATSLVMLARHLRGLARLLVMSATLSDAAVSAIAGSLGCTTRQVSEGEARGWPGFLGIVRHVEVADRPIEAKSLLASLAEAGWPPRVLVVVNTVGRAQELYEALALEGGQHPYSTRLLHSRYLASDRVAIERPALNLFRKTRPADASPSLLIATQVVEVGLDLSCDRLHTEAAPASVLVQRFGRCARWPGEEGRIVVHPLEVDGAGGWRLGPYRSEEALVRHTWEHLVRCSGIRMGPFEAEELVSRVHGEDDGRRFAALDLGAVDRQVATALDSGNLAMRRERIRDVDSVSALVLDDAPPAPDPRRVAEWVSVPRPTLYGLAADHRGVIVRTFDFEAEGPVDWPGTWRREPLGVEVVRSASLLLLPPAVASYSPITGLRLGGAGSSTPVRERPEIRRPRFGYQRELYLQHVERVLRSGQALEAAAYPSPEDSAEVRPGMAVALAVLDGRLGTPGATALLCRLASALHDVGKLSRPWQEWADAWEHAVNLAHRDEPLAHTTFDPAQHEALERSFRRGGPRRPPHAVASALACERLVHDVVAQLLAEVDEQRRTNVADAVLTAIGRHHAPRAREGEAFLPISGADALVKRSLELAGVTSPDAGPSPLMAISQRRQMARFEDEIAIRLGVPSDRGGLIRAREAMALYWLIVRYLRIADGHSQVLARVEEA